MKRVKTLLHTALALCMALTLAVPVGAVQTETPPGQSNSTDQVPPAPSQPNAETPSNFPVIENNPILSSGITWLHTAPYVHARIYIYNSTSEEMKVTLTINEAVYDIYTVPAKRGLTRVYNNLPTGTASMGFQTASQIVSGSVGVRVADTAFPKPGAPVRTHFAVVENASVTHSGATWLHTAPYLHARVYVYNGTEEDMTVTLSVSETPHDTYTVPAGSGLTRIYNNLPAGAAHVDFQTDSGVVSGGVGVRVSSKKF